MTSGILYKNIVIVRKMGGSMKILVLNGSPRMQGNTIGMIRAFEKGAKKVGHEVVVIAVCRKKLLDV